MIRVAYIKIIHLLSHYLLCIILSRAPDKHKVYSLGLGPGLTVLGGVCGGGYTPPTLLHTLAPCQITWPNKAPCQLGDLTHPFLPNPPSYSIHLFILHLLSSLFCFVPYLHFFLVYSSYSNSGLTRYLSRQSVYCVFTLAAKCHSSIQCFRCGNRSDSQAHSRKNESARVPVSS